MMQPKILKKGYMLEIASSENDADSSKIEVVFEEDLETAKAIAECCNLFFCDGRGNGLGNTKVGYWDDESSKVSSTIKDICSKRGISEYTTNVILEDVMCEYIGMWNEGESFRYCDSVSMYEIPYTIELKVVPC